jgi:hypothetical protein
VQGFRLGPLFTPPSLAAARDGTRSTLMVPQFNGGSNWEGGAADPETGFVYVGTARNFSTITLAPSNGQTTANYVGSAAGPRMPNGLPLLKPPYGQIVAYDMNKGDCLGYRQWRHSPEHQGQRSAARPADSANRKRFPCGHACDKDAALCRRGTDWAAVLQGARQKDR